MLRIDTLDPNSFSEFELTVWEAILEHCFKTSYSTLQAGSKGGSHYSDDHLLTVEEMSSCSDDSTCKVNTGSYKHNYIYKKVHEGNGNK